MNKKTFTTKRKAFSLIELSIVLIIIGLLIAGVAGGASLIRNANLRGVMTEARGFQTAVNSFRERFDALPGDFNVLVGGPSTAGAAVGNLNGQIQYFSNIVGVAANRLEGNIAWQQLLNGGFIDNVFRPGHSDAEAGGVISAATFILTPGSNPGVASVAGGLGGIPASRLADAGWAFDYNLAALQNQLIITRAVTSPARLGTDISANMQPVGALPPVDALSIDTKVDDGSAITGTVRSAGHSAAAVIPTVTNAATSNGLGLNACNAGVAGYATATTTRECALAFQVDIN